MRAQRQRSPVWQRSVEVMEDVIGEEERGQGQRRLGGQGRRVGIGTTIPAVPSHEKAVAAGLGTVLAAPAVVADTAAVVEQKRSNDRR